MGNKSSSLSNNNFQDQDYNQNDYVYKEAAKFHEGFLCKKGQHLGLWVKRYFILTEDFYLISCKYKYNNNNNNNNNNTISSSSSSSSSLSSLSINNSLPSSESSPTTSKPESNNNIINHNNICLSSVKMKILLTKDHRIRPTRWGNDSDTKRRKGFTFQIECPVVDSDSAGMNVNVENDNDHDYENGKNKNKNKKDKDKHNMNMNTNMKSNSIIESSSKNNHHHINNNSNKKVFHFEASSEYERDLWMKAINNIINMIAKQQQQQQRQQQRPSKSSSNCSLVSVSVPLKPKLLLKTSPSGMHVLTAVLKKKKKKCNNNNNNDNNDNNNNNNNMNHNNAHDLTISDMNCNASELVTRLAIRSETTGLKIISPQFFNERKQENMKDLIQDIEKEEEEKKKEKEKESYECEENHQEGLQQHQQDEHDEHQLKHETRQLVYKTLQKPHHDHDYNKNMKMNMNQRHGSQTQRRQYNVRNTIKLKIFHLLKELCKSHVINILIIDQPGADLLAQLTTMSELLDKTGISLIESLEKKGRRSPSSSFNNNNDNNNNMIHIIYFVNPNFYSDEEKPEMTVKKNFNHLNNIQWWKNKNKNEKKSTQHEHKHLLFSSFDRILADFELPFQRVPIYDHHNSDVSCLFLTEPHDTDYVLQSVHASEHFKEYLYGEPINICVPVICHEENVFTMINMNQPNDMSKNAFRDLFGGHMMNSKLLSNLAKQVAQLCLTLNEYPFIRFQVQHPVSASFAMHLQDELNDLVRRCNSFEYYGMNPKMNESRATLLIFLRIDDLACPLLHSSKLQTLVQDIFCEDIVNSTINIQQINDNNNKRHSSRRSKRIHSLTNPNNGNANHNNNNTTTVVVNEQKKNQNEKSLIVMKTSNSTWRNNRHRDITRVVEMLQHDIMKFRDHPAGKYELQGKDAIEFIRLPELIRSSPNYNFSKQQCLNLIKLCSKTMEEASLRLIPDIIEMEQILFSQLAYNNRDGRGGRNLNLLRNYLKEKYFRNEFLRLLSECYDVRDRYRLVALWTLVQKEDMENQEKRDHILKKANLPVQAQRGILMLKKLNDENKDFTSIESSSDNNDITKIKNNIITSNNIKKDNDYLNKSKLLCFVEKAIEGSLNEKDFSYVFRPPSTYFTQQNSMKKKKKSLILSSSSITSAINKEDIKPTREPKYQHQRKDNRERFIVFALGGITNYEIDAIHNLSNSKEKDIIIGSTNILSATDFLSNLEEMMTYD